MRRCLDTGSVAPGATRTQAENVYVVPASGRSRSCAMESPSFPAVMRSHAAPSLG